MTYDEFKQNFLPEFLKINSFAGRIKYADQNLQRIGSGSGRIVYDIDGEKVLKLAKNQKGIAQNEAEAGAGYYRNTQHIVTQIFENADDDTWIIAEKGKKVTDRRIREVEGIPSLEKLYDFLKIVKENQRPGRNMFAHLLTPEENEFFWENEFSSALADFAINYGQEIGDMGRPSSYGEVMRNGQPSIVLTDYGLNDEVYQTHYSPQRKQKYQMYELFNFADGNDDILSDTGDQGDIRRGMWAQMPYSVSDGQGVINEKFINFVLKHNKYPDKPISGLPFLTDKFHECVNNIKETLNFVENKKQFYGNLLELQNYLIRRGFYNRDPLISEEYEINEEIPAVQQYGLENRNYSDELARQVAGKLGLTAPKFLGGGANGFAYEINDNLVMKLTSDVSEADAASKLMRGNPKHISKIFNLYKVVDTDKNQAFFTIMQDNIKDKPVEKIRHNIEVINQIEPQGMNYEDIMVAIKKPTRFDYNQMVELAKHILTDNPDVGFRQTERQSAYEFLIGMLNIRKELLEFGIKSSDYITIANLGYKNGVLTFFDVGGYFGVNEPNVGDDNIISLPENEIIAEDYDKDIANRIASQVAAKLNLKITPMRGGNFGFAYDVGNDKVLKITKDNSEAAENLMLIGKPLKYIAQPYNVYEIKSNDDKSIPKTYAIILEKLDTDPNIERQYNRLEYAFTKILDVSIPDVIEHYLGEWDNPKVDKNKIDSYFRKNPQDAEFFGGLLRIAEETKSYGVESIDYLNSSNLGYKKNGNLGFFDVGFGNGFLQPQNLEKIEVDEDGSAKFSTTNAVGQDDFPPYNTNDTSPMINNDLDANIAMYEDLEYNHVSDATKDEYQLNEEYLGVYDDVSNFEIFKNPKSIKRLSAYVRGIVDENGDLFMIDDGWTVIHNDLYKWLKRNNYISSPTVDVYDAFKYGNLVTVQRYGKTNKFYLGETINPSTINRHFERFKLLLAKAKEKNPEIEFIMENIMNISDDEHGISENRNKSFGSGSKTVKVKKKCKLGGQGNTSVACNQGDINNLEFGSVNETGEGNAEPYEVHIIKSTDYDKEYAFRTEDDDKYLIRFSRLSLDNNNWYVVFGIDDEFNHHDFTAVVNKGRLFKVMATILKVMRGFLINTKPNCIEIEPMKKKSMNDDDRSRFSLYLQYIKKNLPSDYEYLETKDAIYINKKKDNNLNEVQLISLQDLPFKQEVEQLGGKIFSIGGAVRDEFLGKESKDLDVLISGIPMDELEQVLSKYGGVNAVGKSFGVLKFVPKGSREEIDIAIPRTEKPSGEGGHKGFDITSDHALPIEKDLERRDFTINAIAKDTEGNIVDPFNGQEDLKNKIIRIVNPDAFSDDPLRMLRAVQFASRFGFEIEPKTMQMIIDNAEKIKEIAPERILIELDKIVTKGNSLIGVQLLSSTGLFKQIFGNEIKPSQIGRRDFTGVRTMAELLFLMMNGVVQNPAEFYLSRFSTEDAKRDKVYKELQALDLAFNSDLLDQQMMPVKARSIAHNMYKVAPQTLESQILPEQIERAGQELLQGKYPKTVNELAVNGNDLMNAGLRGRAIGDIQKSMLIQIYADKVRNNKEDLLSLVGEKNKEMQEGYLNYNDLQPSTWDINGKQVGIDFFVREYDKWNGQYGNLGYRDVSRESVSEFLQNNYEDESTDEKLKKELYWALIDRDLLNENVHRKNIINEMSINSISFENIITPQYLKDLEGSDNYDRFLELFQYENNLEDTEEAMQHPDFKNWLMFELETRYRDTIANIEDRIKSDNTIDIWRMMTVEKGWLQQLPTSGKHLGIYWSWDKNAAEPHWGYGGDITVLIKSSVREESINWHDTIIMNMDISLGEDEKEIRLFKNTKLKIEELYVDGENIMNSPENSVLKNKTFLAEDNIDKVLYSAVVLDDKSRTKLIKVFKPMIPEGWEIIAHHQTIKMGALENGSKEKQDMENDTEISLKVLDYAMDDMVMAVGVEGYSTTNAKPHVTIAVNRAEGGKPFMSNKLTDWRPIDFLLKLTGKVKEE